VYHVDPGLLNVLLAFVLPAAVAVITKRHADDAFKSLVLAGLSLLAVGIQTAIDLGGDFDVKGFLWTSFVQFVYAVAAHYGLLKPTRVTGQNGAIALAVPGGVGPVSREADVVDAPYVDPDNGTTLL